MADTLTYTSTDDQSFHITLGSPSKKSPTLVPLKDDSFNEAAGLQRSGTSGRKSSVEKMLEESLNTAEKEDYSTSRNSSFVSNGTLSGSDDDDGAVRRGGKRAVVKPSAVVPLKDDSFIEAAGLQRSAKSGRKSSVEKLLEESLNTAEKEDYSSSKNSSFLSNGTLSGSDDDDGAVRRGGKRTVERPQNLKSDDFIQSAGLSRTGNVGRKSSMEKLLEDQLQTREETAQVTRKVYTENSEGDQYLVRDTKPLQKQSSISSTEEDIGLGKRKNSIYEQKNIEVPVATKGNRIAARTQNLFKQYERDMSIHEAKPIVDVNEGAAQRKVSYDESLKDEKRKVDLVRAEKEKELLEMRLQYQQRLQEEEREQEEERKRRIANSEIKYTRALGDVKNRYLSAAVGQPAEKNDSDEDDNKTTHVDKHGVPVEKSGGKIEIVRSSDGVGNIRERFGSIGKAGWKKRNTTDGDVTQVDSSKVSSARNVFKTFEVNNNDVKTFNRPTSRKIRDPKELMEMRKKITYGGHTDELPQDGVIKKSVVLDENELGTRSPKKDALRVYKTLESRVEDTSPQNKPTVRLLSESETRANMEVKRFGGSSSNSEAGDVMSDLTVDVSGYGSSTLCSPTSTASDGYSSLSDTKEPVDDMLGKGHIQEFITGDLSDMTISVNGDVIENDEQPSHENVENYEVPTYC